jgi:hypothetical protein
LGKAGSKLWGAVAGGRELSAAHRALLLNACRIADRLDEIDEEIPRAGLTVVNHQGTECVNPLIPEQRQQLSQLSAVLTRMGFKELPKDAPKRTVKDQMAEQRAKRAQRVAGG